MRKLIFLLLFIPILVLAQPALLQENNITETSADLSWVDASCSGDFFIRYRVTGSGAFDRPFNVGSAPPYTLTALVAGTSYDWKVRCENGAWSVVNTFSTLFNGCTDPTACNFDPLATVDDGSCILPDGCFDPTACNYNSLALCDDGSCILPDGCTDPTAFNYDPTMLCDDGSCVYVGPTIDTAFISHPIFNFKFRL
mgnify:CR=1 FL=1